MKNYVSYPSAESLVEAPEPYSNAWNCVSGSLKREYFSQSPFATVTAYARGFVVENIVTGGKHPVPTWERAVCLRAQLASRYQTISTRAGW